MYIPIVLLLRGGQLDVDDGLLLGRDVLGHVLLHPSEEVRGDAALQLLDLYTYKMVMCM